MKKSIVITVALLALGVGASTMAAPSGRVIFPSASIRRIKSAVRQPLPIVGIDTKMAKQNRQVIRTWVSGSIDLNKATQRQQTRFDRKSYIQNVNVDVLRLPTEQLKLTPINPGSNRIKETQPENKQIQIKPQLNLPQVQQIKLKKPMLTIYREGPAYFKFQKLKESPARQALSNSTAIRLARKFVEKNTFVKQTSSDRIGQVFVRERRINEEGTQKSRNRDYLVQQDVILQRVYQGKPVINSKIVVGLQPDSKDIVLLKHFNWTPTQEGQTKQLRIPAVKPIRIPATAVIQRRLTAKIKQVSGNFKKATVKEVIPAWFQTRDSLLPVIAFGINIEYPSPIGTLQRDYLEVINLAGNDDVFFPAQTQTSAPTRAN